MNMFEISNETLLDDDPKIIYLRPLDKNVAENDDQILNVCLSQCMKISNATQGYFFLWSADDQELQLANNRSAFPNNTICNNYSKKIINNVFDENQLLVADNIEDEILRHAYDDIPAQSSGSILCIPLIYNDFKLGVLYLENILSGSRFTRSVIDLIYTLSIGVLHRLYVLNSNKKYKSRLNFIQNRILIQSKKVVQLKKKNNIKKKYITAMLNELNNYMTLTTDLIDYQDPARIEKRKLNILKECIFELNSILSQNEMDEECTVDSINEELYLCKNDIEHKSQKNTVNFHKTKRNIYIIESSIYMMEYFRIHFKDQYNLFSCDNYDDALLELLECPSPHIIILDINEKSIDQFDFSKFYNTADFAIAVPIIVISSNESVLERKKALAKGAIDYIKKPFSFNELTAKINSYIKLQIASEEKIIKMFKHNMLETIRNQQFELELVNSQRKYIHFQKRYNLTDNEINMLKLIEKGLIHKQIAQKLGLSESTIKNTAHKIYMRCNIKSKTELLKLINCT